MEGCLACDLAEGRRELPGGLICETAHWLVEHCVGPLGVGTLIVKPKRHVVHVWELDEDETQELGPLLRQTAGVVADLTEPDQVYVCLWSHKGGRPGHIHFVVQPASPEDGLYGPRRQAELFERDEAPPREKVELFAELARARF